MNTKPKKVLRFSIALVTVALIFIALQKSLHDATADGEPYSVSLNSPVTFPVDI